MRTGLEKNHLSAIYVAVEGVRTFKRVGVKWIMIHECDHNPQIQSFVFRVLMKRFSA